jgi:hypothetical protein
VSVDNKFPGTTLNLIFSLYSLNINYSESYLIIGLISSSIS